jgi:2-oxoglutarate/2-oxoacid ferredoxin oxidoreductase subunit alpha
MTLRLNYIVGGEAGQGVQTIGFWLAKMFSRAGYYVFADQDYESRIRGGHSFFRIRIDPDYINAPKEEIDILIALDERTIDLHSNELTKTGIIIYDEENVKTPRTGAQYFGIPMAKIATEAGGSRLMTNSVALAVALGLFDFDLKIIEQVMLEQFPGETGTENIKVARAGRDYAVSHYANRPGAYTPASGGKKMLINSNEGISLGALAAGCKFLAAYPMTPSTPILEFLAAQAKDFNIAVLQSEDEIAAVNMAVGAAYAGARAMTVTSGSGFCLMVEGVGLAGITETPVVIVDGMRPGPAVGLPTRTEQGDLSFVLTCHQGDFPRAVMAPVDAEDAFWTTIKAFNLADEYQIPVIILNDHYLSTAYSSVDKFDTAKVIIERGSVFKANGNTDSYKRHQLTADGISPRAFPGLTEALVVTDSDEHDEEGHLIEDAKTRKEQMDKRMSKIVPLRGKMSPPKVYGPDNAETSLVSWGSTYGALREAVDILQKENISVNLIQFTDLWPFPEGAADILFKAKKFFIVENNYTGQLARLIRQETGKQADGMILKYDGRPFLPSYVVEQFKKEAA